MIYVFIDYAFTIYFWMIIIRILGSWFPEAQENRIFQFIRYYTEPYLALFRRIIPPIGGALDISPIIAIFVLRLIESMLLRFLWFV